MDIVWTKHAEDRQKEWEEKHGITKQKVEALMRGPEQIVPGDMDVLVAQAKFNNGLLRAPFADIMGNRKILTVYWTSKVERYWGKEAKDEDKI